MGFRGDVVGAGEDLAPTSRDLLDPAAGAFLDEPLGQPGRGELLPLGHLLEVGVDFEQAFPVEDLADEGQGVEGLDAGGAARQDRDRPGGSDGGDHGIAHRGAGHEGAVAGVPGACGPVGEGAPVPREVLRRLPGLVPDEAHEGAGEGEAPLRVVRHAQAEEHVRPAHHAQPDLPVALHDLLDLGLRVGVHVDDIVEEAHCQRGGVGQGLPADPALGRRGRAQGAGRLHEVREVDRPEVAGLPGEQSLLSARIGSRDLAERRRRVAAVHSVDEEEPRLARLPGAADDQRVDVPRRPFVVPVGQDVALGVAEFLAERRLPACMGVDDVVLQVAAQGAEELVGHGDREVEVRELARLDLGVDEVQDVGVVDAEDAHVGAAPEAALVDRVGGGVEDPHEADRAACAAVGRVDAGRLRPDAREIEAGAAAGLVDEGGGAKRVEDALVLAVDDGVGDGEDEAGEVLAQAAAGVHEGGRVGEEIERGHHPVEAAGGILDAGLVGAVQAFRDGHVDGDAPEHFLGGFGGAAVLVLEEVAFLQDREGVGAERHGDVGADEAPQGVDPSPVGRSLHGSFSP